jgi:hypothetical protein
VGPTCQAAGEREKVEWAAGKKWAASSTGPSRADGSKKGGEGRWVAGKKEKEGGEWAAWAGWGWMGFGVWVRFVFFSNPFKTNFQTFF